MKKEEYLAICLSNREKMKKLDGCNNLYDLEKEVHVVFNSLGRDILEKQLGDVPADRRKKKPKK
jgi:hypothetical protein